MNRNTVTGLDNGLALTPPMGWLAWERFRCNTDCEDDPVNCISERLFRNMADMLVVGGWKEVGYEYIMLDDCWSSMQRSDAGELMADPDRFPSGIKALAGYVHKLGLKIGIYADYGTATCGGYPGSLGHLETDAKTFASWDVDYVKMDGCNSDPKTMDQAFPEFGRALNATGRPMIYQCEWPLYQGGAGIIPNYTRIRESCNLWRNFYDVQDNWHNILLLTDYYGDNKDGFLQWGGPGGWNDPDMLVGGNFGLSYDQARAQLALWTVLTAPLILSVDLRTIRPEFRDLLQHRGVIKISQDPLGLPGYRVARKEHLDFFVRPVTPVVGGKHSLVLVILNRWDMGGTPLKVEFNTAVLGQADSSTEYEVFDVFESTELGQFGSQDHISVHVNPLGVRILRFNVKKNTSRREKSDATKFCKVSYPGETGRKNQSKKFFP